MKFITKSAIILSAAIAMSGCTPQEQALGVGVATGVVIASAVYSQPYYGYGYNAPYYYQGGRYYYGGYYRSGYYHHNGNRYRNGRYYRHGHTQRNVQRNARRSYRY